MRKKGLLLIGTILTLGLLTACGSSAAPEGEAEASSAETITVTFLNQDETLGTATAAAGEILDPISYEAFTTVDGATLNGWYETPSFLESSKKDLSVDSFTKDTTLYGDFEYDEVAEDTRHWYIAGTSATGSLGLNNWATDLSDEEKAQFELVPTGNKTNEFALTIDLYTGDQFQIIPDWSWDGQKGYGKFTGLDESEMKNAGGLDGSDEKSNLEVLTDGNYTITLTTNPDNEVQDTLTIVRNSDPLGE